MTLPIKTPVRGAVAAASVLALTAGVTPALAQVPGGGVAGYVVKVDDTSLVVTVDDKPENASGPVDGTATVTGTIENTSTANFRCEVPEFDKGGKRTPVGYGQVSTAAVAAEVTEYYRTTVFTGPSDTNANGDLVSMGSLYDLFPSGSAVGSSETNTRTAHTEARVAGRTGDPRVGGALQFTVNAGQTVEYSAILGPPSTGDRGQWQASAMFMCRNMTTNEWFLYTGLENFVDPNPAPEPESTGSLGRLGAGSLGS